MERPIVIAGFGRSGTTWVSDIVSKSTGGLVLFEPDHPKVFEHSGKYLYRANDQELDQDILRDHVNKILSKENRNIWLLRNHLLSGEETSEEFINMIWDESKIVGIKAIRWNHNLSTIYKNISDRLIFIIRHPLAVTASLIKRSNFFGDFGWDVHWALFKERQPLKHVVLDDYDNMEPSCRYISMWTVSNMVALMDLDKMGVPFFEYEKLYFDPYHESKKILRHLKIPKENLHPSYLFYPSMSTLRTMHTLNYGRTKQHNHTDFFWKDIFTKEKAIEYLDIVKTISSHYPTASRVFRDLGYLDDIE